VDWESFFTGTATGLVIAGVVGAVRWYTKRREKRAQEAALEYDRRAPIRVGGHIVATELRANAEIARRCEEGHARIPAEGKMVRVRDWSARKHEMAGLRDENPDLWRRLEETYHALELTKARGAYPPRSASLLELADHVDDAAER
jgi:hypothetical protein